MTQPSKLLFIANFYHFSVPATTSTATEGRAFDLARPRQQQQQHGSDYHAPPSFSLADGFSHAPM
jgi:hypothetical protein